MGCVVYKFNLLFFLFGKQLYSIDSSLLSRETIKGVRSVLFCETKNVSGHGEKLPLKSKFFSIRIILNFSSLKTFMKWRGIYVV